MHNVLDPCDIVPDEAEQLTHSGYDASQLLTEARRAAADGDIALLKSIADELQTLNRSAGWTFVEPEDDEELLALGSGATFSRPDDDALLDRLRGAWTGRAIGNTMGKPVEGLSRQEVEIYLRAAGQWPQRGYIRLLDPLPEGIAALHPSARESSLGTFSDVPRDDDIDWAILTLHMLEQHGIGLTTADIADHWLDRIPFTQTYTAERAAYRNLTSGLTPPLTATFNNPYREWVGALIRADVYGFVNPGRPSEATRLALIDARLSHVGNGVYGEMWAAALLSIALCVDTPEEALDGAAAFVPPGSRLAAALRGLRDLHARGVPADEALNWIDRELGHYNWVHTIICAAAIAYGLLWGTDFVDSVALTVSVGRDTDSTAATVGSVVGALHGFRALPTDLIGTTHRRIRSSIRDYDRVAIEELAERTLAVEARVARELERTRAHA
ncbi:MULTISPECIES: ADP-ribosylglycohydrolase family protein [Microbacterium]|uniref:ADP-ribosylglycohydrolase family protein n=1 Tax=Microbacterium TaxID=33882 RepID=UPI00146AAB79|nr:MULTISPECIES: ADP-ribosylglycohydrolase family protein [Microbacterium]